MCLCLHDNWKEQRAEFRSRQLPAVVFKIVRPDMTSMYHPGYVWKEGENISNRESTDLTEEEIKTLYLEEGFHFLLEEPESCSQPYLCPHRYQCLCPYPYRCVSKDPVNKLIKCEVAPKDVVAVGKWEHFDCLVAIEATMIGEAK